MPVKVHPLLFGLPHLAFPRPFAPQIFLSVKKGDQGGQTSQAEQKQPERFQIVAGADPVPGRVEKIRKISGRADFRAFASAEAARP